MDIAECDYEVNYDCKNTLNWIATFMTKYISKGGGLPEFLLRVQSLYLQFVAKTFQNFSKLCFKTFQNPVSKLFKTVFQNFSKLCFKTFQNSVSKLFKTAFQNFSKICFKTFQFLGWFWIQCGSNFG